MLVPRRHQIAQYWPLDQRVEINYKNSIPQSEDTIYNFNFHEINIEESQDTIYNFNFQENNIEESQDTIYNFNVHEINIELIATKLET